MADLGAVAARIELEPVFTAHPTEVARRSVLTKLRRIGELLEVRRDSIPADQTAVDERLAEVIDLLWETDELRRERPTPADEASAVNYYVDDLARNVVPLVVDDFVVQLRALGIDLPHRRPTPALRQLGRGRPGRQPQRDPVGDRRCPGPTACLGASGS